MGRKRTDSLRSFLQGDIHYADLTLAEREYLEQLKLVESLWADGKPDVVVRRTLFEVYAISDNTARQSMRDCMLLFGDLKKVDRNMLRYRASQMALNAYDFAYQEGDTAGMIRATNAFVEANGLNKDDPDLPDFENMTGGVIIAAIPEGMEKMIKALAQQGGVMDHTRLPELEQLPDLPEEPEYEEATIEAETDESES